MITIYDCLTDSEISARNKKDLAVKIGVDPSKVSRLTTGFHISIADRYTMSKENCFILEEIETGRELICANTKSFFVYFGKDFEENAGKYIYEVLNNRQKTFSFNGFKYKAKSKPKNQQRRKELFPRGHNRITCPYKKMNNEILGRVRCRLWGALNNQLKKKNRRTLEYLGCSIEFLMGWLESQFVDGMSWERRGEIHIDHIIPCNTFDFNNEEEVYKCFHYTNLRPLWSKDNLSRPKDGSDIVY